MGRASDGEFFTEADARIEESDERQSFQTELRRIDLRIAREKTKVAKIRAASRAATIRAAMCVLLWVVCGAVIVTALVTRSEDVFFFLLGGGLLGAFGTAAIFDFI